MTKIRKNIHRDFSPCSSAFVSSSCFLLPFVCWMQTAFPPLSPPEIEPKQGFLFPHLFFSPATFRDRTLPPTILRNYFIHFLFSLSPSPCLFPLPEISTRATFTSLAPHPVYSQCPRVVGAAPHCCDSQKRKRQKGKDEARRALQRKGTG